MAEPALRQRGEERVDELVAGHRTSATAVMLLVLFDVDGTLFVSHDPLVRAGDAATRSRTVYGLRAPGRRDVAGRPPGPHGALDHARECCARPGSATTRSRRASTRWCEAVSARYLELLEAAEHGRAGRRRPGTAEALERHPGVRARSRCSPGTRSRSPGRAWSGSGSPASSPPARARSAARPTSGRS